MGFLRDAVYMVPTSAAWKPAAARDVGILAALRDEAACMQTTPTQLHSTANRPARNCTHRNVAYPAHTPPKIIASGSVKVNPNIKRPTLSIKIRR